VFDVCQKILKIRNSIRGHTAGNSQHEVIKCSGNNIFGEVSDRREAPGCQEVSGIDKRKSSKERKKHTDTQTQSGVIL